MPENGPKVIFWVRRNVVAGTLGFSRRKGGGYRCGGVIGKGGGLQLGP